MGVAEVADLEVKYSSLLCLIAMRPGLERDRGLRALAARWPGVLREGQLAPLEALRARARALVEIGALDRAAWRDRGQAAVPLWSELHRLLGDLAGVRRSGPPAGGEADVVIGGAAGARWPTDPTWWSARSWPPGAQLPRSWLAAVSGASPLDLDRMLRGSTEP
ncbi:MAG: hypothetical protein JNK45_25665 [Myxococcales bacterium]|nr:hypothetical protein [Myxococcales bacterium]